MVFKLGLLAISSIAVILRSEVSNAVIMSCSSYRKVPNVLPTEISKCFMQQMPCTMKQQCLTYCVATPNCFLSCFNGSSCSLYNATVDYYWNPSSFPSTELANYKCYSSQFYHNDLTPNITATKVFSTMLPYVKEYAISGYYCPSGTNYFHNNFAASGWYEAELDSIHKIMKVVITAVGNVYTDTFFRNVEVRVGNISGYSNFDKNSMLASYAGTAGFGEKVSFDTYAPIYGKLVAIKTGTSYLVMGDLKIIGV